jgi:purine-cytosine permease-like protein
MAENDEASGSDVAGTPYLPVGPRRSTYTPPTGNYPPAFLQREEPSVDQDRGEQEQGEQTERGGTQGEKTQGEKAQRERNSDEAAQSVRVQNSRPDVGAEPQPAPAPLEQPSPVPPATASIELPERPQRRSLEDDELVRALSPEVEKPADTLSAIEQLQAELELRQQDAAEFTAWEGRMREIGTPEALETIAEVIPQFTGVIPIITTDGVPTVTARALEQNDAGAEPTASAGAATDVPVSEPEGAADRTAWSPPAPDASAAPFAPPAGSMIVPPAAPPLQTAFDNTEVLEDTPPQPPSLDDAVPAPFLNPEQFPPPRLEERVDVAALGEPDLSDGIVLRPPWLRPPSEESQVAPTEQSVDQAPESFEQSEDEAGEQSAGEFVGHLPDAAAAGEPTAGPAEELEVPPTTEPVIELQSSEAQSSEAQSSEAQSPEAQSPEVESPEAQSPEAQSSGPDPAEAAEQPEPAPRAPEAPVIYDLVDPNAPTASAPVRPVSVSPFDALLVGDVAAVPADEEARPFSLLHSEPTSEAPQTGSVPVDSQIIDTRSDDDDDDDVDETDRAFGDLDGPFPVTSEGVVVLPAAASAPIEPMASPRGASDEQPVIDAEHGPLPVFAIELSGEEATPADRRTGRAARMFWLWFATNSSVVSVAFGAALFGLGMSLRQAILAAFIGVAISFLPLGLGTLAGKWSGQPTIVVSRATFGLVGNIVPAVLAFVTRLFWGAVLLWLVAVCTARILVGASLGGPFNEQQLAFVAAAVGLVIAFVIAFFGYPLFARVQLVFTIVSAVLIVGLLALTWHAVDIRTALTVGDGPWILVATGVVLVFSFVGLVWANSSGDIARYQRPSGSGASASLWASFGATLPAFLLIAYGALLAASNPGVSGDLLSAPLDAIALMIPTWYPVPLLAATVLSLLSGVALSLYSGAFALQSIGVRLRRQWSVVVVGIVLFGIAILIVLSGTGIVGIFRDFATTLAVPVAAWAGLFAAEVMIRRRRFDEQSLLTPGGVYPSVNWVNLVMLFVASAIGFGFTSATVGWLSWQGFGFALFGVPADGVVASSDIGVLVALVIGLITPLAAGISTVRRQELAEQ